jgi:hypothetical protein
MGWGNRKPPLRCTINGAIYSRGGCQGGQNSCHSSSRDSGGACITHVKLLMVSWFYNAVPATGVLGDPFA